MHDTQAQLKPDFGYFRTVKPLVQLVWRASPPFFVILLALTLLGGLLPAANIFINSALLDTLVRAVQAPPTSPTPPVQLIVLLVGLGCLILLGQFLGHLNSAVQNLYQVRVTNFVRLTIAEKAASLDLAFFENPEFHNMMRNASSEASFRPVMIVRQLMTMASTLTTLLTLAGVVLLWQAWMFPLIIVSSLATFWVSGYFGKAHVDLVVDRAEMDRKIQYFQTELTSDLPAKEVRLFSLQRFFLPKMRELLEIMYQQDRQLARRQVVYNGLVETALSVVQPVLIGFTALQVIRQAISIGYFSLYTGSIVYLYSSLRELMFTLAQLHESNLFVANLFRFLALQPYVEAPRPKSQQHRAKISPQPLIEFRNVSFRYPDTERRVIENLNLRISPGEAVALVGENGAGKTTIVKLLTGLYEPTEGQILFDEVDIGLLARDELRSFLSVIFQDFGIYHLSVYDNIGLGRIDRIADCEASEAISRQTGLDPIVQALPHGYETIIGRFFDRGHELSGGQRQLVALTRSLVRDAPILVLDEPTAALDIYTERRFFQALLNERVAHVQSVLFISHRFTTVRSANRILVLEHGTVVEEGNHAALMARNGRYAAMFNAQLQMYGESSEQPDEARQSSTMPTR